MEKEKGVLGQFRKAFRILGDHSESIEAVLDLIPDELWGKALRISLGWMFSVCPVCPSIAQRKKRGSANADLQHLPSACQRRIQ